MSTVISPQEEEIGCEEVTWDVTDKLSERDFAKLDAILDGDDDDDDDEYKLTAAEEEYYSRNQAVKLKAEKYWKSKHML